MRASCDAASGQRQLEEVLSRSKKRNRLSGGGNSKAAVMEACGVRL